MNIQILLIEHQPAIAADTPQAEAVATVLKIRETDGLKICRHSPFTVTELVLVHYIVLIAQVDTFKRKGKAMKRNFGKKNWMFPMPVLMIGTYNDDGTPN